MRRFTIAAALLAGTALSASAAEVWQGSLFITAASAACTAEGIVANDFFTAVYRPRNVSDNGVDTRLSLVASRSAQRYAVTNASMSGSGSYDGVMITSRANVQTWTGTFSSATISPSTPTATTKTVLVKVTFNNFGDVIGCKATLTGSLGNRP